MVYSTGGKSVKPLANLVEMVENLFNQKFWWKNPSTKQTTLFLDFCINITNFGLNNNNNNNLYLRI